MINFHIIFLFALLILSAIKINAEGEEKNKQQKLYKTNGQPEYALFNINNISTYIKNDGRTDNKPDFNTGFIFPNSSNKGVFYLSGFLYGGKVDGQIIVGGSTYRQGQVPGRIVSEGIAESTELPHVRIYRVRRDYKTADLSDETIVKIDTNTWSGYSEYNSAAESFVQYEKDWNEWPAIYGAPFEDKNNNGIYEPSIDIPGVPGADQTIWYVCNDLNEETVRNLYGSPPIGIEMQTTIWGYKGDVVLANTIFKKYVLVNKSSKSISDMYVGIWSDPDLGDATDDYVGCDTTLDLVYVYNGDTNDATYGEQIPAAGFKLLQGPLVDGDFNEKGEK